MGQPADHAPVLFVLAAISRHPDALVWARERASSAWGPVALASPVFDFVETDYYASTMGPDLKKQFLAFERLIAPDRLPELKLQSNGWEIEYVATKCHPDARPLNLDPGYLTLAKFVLASTKDHWHRLYLGSGIYAEVTLHFRGGAWQPSEWTYPDYRRADFHEFFVTCREFLKKQSVVNPTHLIQ